MTPTDPPTEALSEREAFEKWYGENVSCAFAEQHEGIYHSAHAVFGSDVKAAWDARGEYERTRPTPKPDAVDGWPENVVADRHETTGKWVLWYLNDEQAAACKVALDTNPPVCNHSPQQYIQTDAVEKIREALELAGETCANEYAYSVATLCKEALALLPTLTAAAELPSLEDVARIIYKWSEIERDDLSIVKYDELSGGLKEMLHRHARAVLTAAKVKWRE